MKSCTSFTRIIWLSILSLFTINCLNAQVTDTIQVSEDWNLLSLPVSATNAAKTSLFPNATSDAYIFQDFYKTKDTLESGAGFWLKFNSAENIIISGNTIYNDTVGVSIGWNMIGSITVPIDVATIQSEPSGIIASDYFIYVPGVGYQATDTIYPGNGCWVKANQNGTIILYGNGIIPPSPSLVSPENGERGQSASLTLYWNAYGGATTYTLQVSIDSVFSSFVYNQDGLTDTSQQISGLNNSTTYYWRVSETNRSGTSDWSSVWNFTPSAVVNPNVAFPDNHPDLVGIEFGDSNYIGFVYLEGDSTPSYTPGTILVGHDKNGGDNGHGYSRKVISLIGYSPGYVDYETEDASLDEVIAEGGIDTSSFPLEVEPDPSEITEYSRSNPKFANSPLSFERGVYSPSPTGDEFTLTFTDLKWEESGINVAIDTVVFTLRSEMKKLKINIFGSSTQTVKVLAELSQSVRYTNVRVSLAASVDSSNEFEVLEKNLGRKVFWIGWVPVVVDFKVKIRLGFAVHLAGEITCNLLETFTQTSTTLVGGEIAKGKFTTTFQTTVENPDLESNPNIIGTVTAKAELWVRPTLWVRFYFSNGPELSIKAGVYDTLSWVSNRDPKLNNEFGVFLEGKIGYKVKILGKNIPIIDPIELFSKRWPLLCTPNCLCNPPCSDTGCPATVDYAGKTYNTVKIGSQCWLKENLNVGTMISGSANPSNNGVIEKYCYNNDPSNCNTYGGLYQWNEAMAYSTTPGARGICPTGWHMPTDAEFQTLSSSVGGDGNALKAIGQGTGSGTGTNTSGFSALLAGDRTSGNFYSLGSYASYWGSTEQDQSNAHYQLLSYNNGFISSYTNIKENGYSVRCLKD